MSNFDYYTATYELAELLKKEKYFDEAALLLSDIENGSTGTEIIMMLRFHVDEMIKKLSLKVEVKKISQTLLSELDNALK
jgi:hypothetical protein